MWVIESKKGITFHIHLIIFGIGGHFCKCCSYIAIDILNQQFVFDFNAKKREVVEMPEGAVEAAMASMPSQDEFMFLDFDSRMFKLGYVRFTKVSDDWSKLHKFINEEHEMITISQKGALDVIKSGTFEDFINSKTKKPEDV